jgi:hypothetical protein
MGVVALLGLASCSTGQRAMQGEADNLYFMASDARIATEFAVRNNTADNFRNLEQSPSSDLQLENFSSRNVNPEYIARYQRSTQPVEEGSVYFDDSQTQSFAPQGGNIDAYDNFRGGSGNVTNNFFGGPAFGMGMGMGMGMWPMGMGMRPMGMWPMGGFYDPFWGPGFFDPFWGPGFGFRPGFNVGFGVGFGNPWMRTSLAFGNPWMMGPGFGFYDPWMMRGFYRPGFFNPIIIVPGGEAGGRQIVRGARPSMGSSLANATPRSRGAVEPGSSRANARRESIGAGPNARQATSTANRNSFSRSQNDMYRNPSASATPARRNVSSPVVTRPTSATATRSGAYSAPNARMNANSPRTSAAPSNFNNRSVNQGNTRSGYTAPTRSASPSYNRSTAPSNRSTSAPGFNSRSTAPSYNQQRSTAPSSSFSSPSRSSSFSAPSSGGGGVSRGGGVSVGGGRRGN